MVIKKVYTKTPVLGIISWNTADDMRGNLESIAINPSSTTTTFDFFMTDDTGTVVYDKRSQTGTFIDDSKIGLYGIYTCTLSNTSTNDPFLVNIIWNENLTG